ncbi:hypothetical protein [Ferrovibrio sp.]|uniref:hypothetical protein n=1 Tax=Ferrovibrio sp. TaxID=1917215 RepID=UPI00311FCB60
MRFRVILLLCLLFALPAAAQLPAVDPGGQYRLIGPADRSDSACIGSPSTPLCAVETLLACFANRDESLCWAVWRPPQAGGVLFAGPARPAYWWSYRIAGAVQTTPDEAVIAIAGRHCGLQLDAPDCSTTPAPPTSYRVRRAVGGGWQVVDWASTPGSGTVSLR